MFAEMRGEPEEQLIYEADDLQIILEVQTRPTEPDHKMLLGLILGITTDQTIEVHLQQADQELVMATVDDLGNFIFDRLAPGTYTLRLHRATNEIRIENLKI